MVWVIRSVSLFQLPCTANRKWRKYNSLGFFVSNSESTKMLAWKQILWEDWWRVFFEVVCSWSLNLHNFVFYSVNETSKSFKISQNPMWMNRLLVIIISINFLLQTFTWLWKFQRKYVFHILLVIQFSFTKKCFIKQVKYMYVWINIEVFLRKIPDILQNSLGKWTCFHSVGCFDNYPWTLSPFNKLSVILSWWFTLRAWQRFFLCQIFNALGVCDVAIIYCYDLIPWLHINVTTGGQAIASVSKSQGLKCSVSYNELVKYFVFCVQAFILCRHNYM